MPIRHRFGAVLGLGSLSGCPDAPVSFGASSTDDEVGDSTDAGTGDTNDTSTETGREELPVDDHRTFFIGESRKFDGGGACNNTNLNTVTRTLRNELVDAGWEGLRFVDEDSWPEDFRVTNIESTLRMGRLDGDTAAVTMLVTSCALRIDQIGIRTKRGARRTASRLLTLGSTKWRA